MANAPAGPGPKDPQAAIAKHSASTMQGAAADAQLIENIEGQISNSPMGWLQSMMGDVSSKASEEQSEVGSKVDEQKQLVDDNQKDAPPDAGPAPQPGQAAKPAVPAQKAPPGKDGAPKAKTGAGKAAPKAKAPGKGVNKGGGAPSGAQASMVGQLAGAQNDTQLDAMLNAYQPRGTQGTEMLGRIRQMGEVAEGFRGQLDVYVAQGGSVEQGIAKVSNFLGVGKDVSAVWATNPYGKMGTTLGKIMGFMSAVKSISGIVGSICGKIGMVLTVIGLLAMIFPPIGAAVSGVARVLNIIGFICDAISFVTSAALMAFNGVVLASQIAAGASAEEKAATADLMMSEANDAAGGLINLAMVFGPKFMKGMLGKSKGFVNSLFRRLKSSVTRVALKLTGPIKNFAAKISRRFPKLSGRTDARAGGQWTSKMQGAKNWVKNSRVGKAFNSAPKALEKVQNKLMDKYGTSWVARKADRIAAWSGSFGNKIDLETKLGNRFEKLGARAGGLGSGGVRTQKWAAAADATEAEVRKTAFERSQREAMDLEDARWRNEVSRRRYRGTITSETAENQFVGKQTQKVGDDMQKKFDLDERKRAGNYDERLETVQKARRERQGEQYWDNNKDGSGPFGGNNSRDTTMKELHDSRTAKFEAESRFKAQDSERKKLLEDQSLNDSQKARLEELNKELSPLDQARKVNKRQEDDLYSLASGGGTRTEIKNWYDVGTNVWEGGAPAWEALGVRSQEKAWQSAEQHNLRKPLKWDGAAAKGAAGGLGGHSTYEEIATAGRRQQMADFSSFVARGRQSLRVAPTARTMLAGINKQPAPQPAPTGNTKTPTAPAAPSLTGGQWLKGASPTQPAPQPQPQPAPTPTAKPTATPTANAAPTPTADPTPAASPPAPGPDAAGNDEASAPLPYWPALLPQFDSALKDFGFMRSVATEFKKTQIDGKQKAVDTLAVYGRYQEYAKLRQDQAKTNQSGAQQTKGATDQNVDQAGGAQAKSGEGAGKQDQAKGSANEKAAVDLPEPESRGFWGRILGAVKRWAKNKAAQIFGWVQEKVASVILKGLCGVSMGDMREYAGALRRQQQRAGGKADEADQQSGQAGEKSIQLGQDASKEAQSAADSIGECDQNITEADRFMADVTMFEQQLMEEKQHAATFLGQVRAAVHAEQEKQKQEEAQRVADEQAAADRSAQLAVGGDDQSGDPTQTPTADGPTGAPPDAPPVDNADPTSADPAADAAGAPDGDDDGDGVSNAAEGEANASQLRATADYVRDSADSMQDQLKTRSEDYQNQLALALTNRTGDSASGEDLQKYSKQRSREIVEEFQTFINSTKSDMATFQSMSIDPSSVSQIADAIIQSAEHLDQEFDESQQALDQQFERTYTGIREGERDLQTRVLTDSPVAGINDGINDATDGAYDATLATPNGPPPGSEPDPAQAAAP
ncbi:MAG: hypothetical protein WKG01_21435 [Kofleriaceae bacterium]